MLSFDGDSCNVLKNGVLKRPPDEQPGREAWASSWDGGPTDIQSEAQTAHTDR